MPTPLFGNVQASSQKLFGPVFGGSMCSSAAISAVLGAERAASTVARLKAQTAVGRMAAAAGKEVLLGWSQCGSGLEPRPHLARCRPVYRKKLRSQTSARPLALGVDGAGTAV